MRLQKRKLSLKKKASKRAETFRLKKLCAIEEQVRAQGFNVIAGVDEAGRGPLAGPVVAAACILPEGYLLRGIDDSKKLTREQRESFYEELMIQRGVFYGVGVVEAIDIDHLNIHGATLRAMATALSRLEKSPDFVLVDGRHLPAMDFPGEWVIDGDRLVQSIAAASIVAKMTRDLIMEGYDLLFPQYGFKNHKGYGTKEHLAAIAKHGLCPIHRRSYKIEGVA
jgi:ribonuclease HII